MKKKNEAIDWYIKGEYCYHGEGTETISERK